MTKKTRSPSELSKSRVHQVKFTILSIILTLLLCFYFKSCECEIAKAICLWRNIRQRLSQNCITLWRYHSQNCIAVLYGVVAMQNSMQQKKVNLQNFKDPWTIFIRIIGTSDQIWLTK